jgi:hypothetical protein
MFPGYLVRIALTFPLLIALFPALASARSDRVALVVGNGAYVSAPRLPNPANDARDFARALRALGFDVLGGVDFDRSAMEREIRGFSDRLEDADIAVFFYAGHGLQVAGRNYLVPIDAKLKRAGDLELDAIDLQVVLAQMEARRGVNLVFLDACRDNPFAKEFASALGATRSADVGRGLAPIQSGVGTLIAFATEPDKLAMDGTGRNSPFTAALIHHIGDPDVDISVIMRRVRKEVLAATDQRQLPWDHSSLIEPVVLTPATGAASPEPDVPSPASSPAPVLSVSPPGDDVAAICRAEFAARLQRGEIGSGADQSDYVRDCRKTRDPAALPSPASAPAMDPITAACGAEFAGRRARGEIGAAADEDVYVADCRKSRDPARLPSPASARRTRPADAKSAACLDEFAAKQAAGDLGPDADERGYVAWCRGRRDRASNGG